METLNFQIVPSSIPLGKTSEGMLIVSHMGEHALENIRGRLNVPASLHLLGLDTIKIAKLPVGEKVSLPIRLRGQQPGPVHISVSRLNARTDVGSVLTFEDKDIAITVLTTIELDSRDLSVMAEPVSSLVQNRIGRVRFRLHNNSNFSLTVSEIIISAHGGECYLGKKQASATIKTVPSGSFLEVDTQILPKVAGEMNLSARLRFLINDQTLYREFQNTLHILPSNQLVFSPQLQETKTILLVSASPQNKDIIRSDKEMRNILFEMKYSAPQRDLFQVDVLPAATVDHLSKRIIYLRPYLIHFAGHGSEQGIVLEDENETAKVLSTDALLGLLRPLSDEVLCIILNACKSLTIAKELAKCIPYVVGMRQEIIDPAAIVFSQGFYEALGAGHPIEKAFEFGRARLIPDHFKESLSPVLFKQGRTM